MGEWTEPVDAAILLHLVFEVETEEFDRTLPGVSKHGAWLPFDRAAMLRFAREKHDEMIEKARQLNIPMERMASARRYFEEHSFSHEYLKRWLAQERGDHG